MCAIALQRPPGALAIAVGAVNDLLSVSVATLLPNMAVHRHVNELLLSWVERLTAESAEAVESPHRQQAHVAYVKLLLTLWQAIRVNPQLLLLFPSRASSAASASSSAVTHRSEGGLDARPGIRPKLQLPLVYPLLHTALQISKISGVARKALLLALELRNPGVTEYLMRRTRFCRDAVDALAKRFVNLPMDWVRAPLSVLQVLLPLPCTHPVSPLLLLPLLLVVMRLLHLVNRPASPFSRPAPPRPAPPRPAPPHLILRRGRRV